MRYNKSLFDKVKSGNFLGINRPNGRVTVDPYWILQKTQPVYGNSFKGPFRYYTDYDASVSTPGVEEYEIPSIKSIQWNRSTSQDLGSCTITLYNMWHNLNSEEQELAGQLGKKGYFWPKRGQGDSSATWNQEAGKGAYRKDGTWDSQFSWENVLVEDVILRCVDVETEILTKRGWLKYNQVKEGDFALGINPSTGLSEWQKIKEIFRKKIDQDVIHLKTRVHDSMTTENHRWLVKNRNDVYVWKTTETLNVDSRIPLAAEFKNTNKKIYEDDFIELAAWYYTEGSYDRRSGSYVNIRQSEKANPEYCDRIYNLLTRLFGAPGALPRGKRLDPEMVNLAVKMLEEGNTTATISAMTGISNETIRRWKTGERTPNLNPAFWDIKRYDDCLTFVISSSVVSELLGCIAGSDKIPSLDFINSMTNKQLNLFIDVSIMADGTEDKNQRCLIQSNEERIKAFEMMCVLAGQPFHTTFRNNGCAKISLLRNFYTSPISSLSQRGLKPEKVHYNDVIWCPRVEHGNWFARRHGCGYFTGNTYEGYGGHPSNGVYKSIDENLDDGDLLLTGVWIVNSVSAGSDGMMTLECTDIGRILIDQIVFPPVIPPGAYPLEYYPPGKSAFDSPWGPKVKGKELVNEQGEVVSTSSANRGEVWIRAFTSSASGDSTVSTNYPASAAVDGDWDTYALSEAYETMTGGRPYWEFLPGSDPNYGAGINSIKLKTWGGGYTVYVSIAEDPDPDNPSSTSVWKGVDTIPDGGIKYIKKVQIPLYLPDGMENPIEIDLADYPEEDDPFTRPTQNTYYAHKVRLTFENLQYSHVPDGTKRYRAGIRDLVFFRDGAEFNNYSPIDGLTPWTFAIEQHPTRGYWVIDSTGRVHGFGDASDYDFNRFGDVPINSYETGNRAVGIAAHPSGEGYWVLDWMGRVWAYGAAADGATEVPTGTGRYNFGEHKVPNPYTAWNQPGKVQARGIAATHTGDGYWVVYSNGVIRGFGDASPSYATVPSNDVAIFMDWFLAQNYPTGTYVPYSVGLKATAIAAHPKKMGFWVTDGSGQVWAFGDAQSYGGLKNRVYRPGMAGRFKLQNLEWATAIESTPSGEGYWIGFGSGRVGSFGDAIKLGKDPYVINDIGVDYPENVIFDDNIEFDNSFFRRIMWGLARDPSGKGFWVLAANGNVTPYEADFWGQPGYTGLTGYKWHDGNFNGDWKDIVADILMWGGFLFYDSDITDSESPSVYGNLESTGIITDTTVPGDKFDKKTLMDVIKELTEVVGYRFRIDEEGRARYESPNWWRAGNFDRDGIRIYVDENGDRVNPEDEGAILLIPTVHESEDLLNYNVTLNSTDKRSEIIIGTDLPNPKDPTTTGYIVHNPPHSLERVAGNTPTMRGIERTAIWVSQLFENEQERKLMAELIGLHSWFSSRVGSCSITANPGLSLDDQVRVIERNTSETFIHLINGISSNNDLDTGEYTMDLTTNWLGSADDWVIKNDDEPSDYVYTVISDNLNSWQVKTDRGLGAGAGKFDSPTVTLTGGFEESVAEVETIPKMVVLGDSMSYLDSTLNGLTGDRWPNLLEDAGSVIDAYNGAMSGYTTDDLVNDPIVAPGDVADIDALVIFIGANDQNESLSGVSPEEFYDNIVTLLGDYPADKQLVVFPWKWTGYPEAEPDPAPTLSEYNNYATKAQEAAEDNGALFLHLGDAIESVIAATGDSDWDDYIVDWIHPSALGHEFIAEQVSSALHVSFGEPDGWEFNANLAVIGTVDNLNITVDTLSNLGYSIFFEIYNSSNSLVFARSIVSPGQIMNYGSIGNSSSVESYTVRITGISTSKGTGKVKLSFKNGSYTMATIEDSIIFLEAT